MESDVRQEAGVQTPGGEAPLESGFSSASCKVGREGSSYKNRGVLQGDRPSRVRAQGGKGPGMVRKQREAQGSRSKGGWCQGPQGARWPRARLRSVGSAVGSHWHVLSREGA